MLLCSVSATSDVDINYLKNLRETLLKAKEQYEAQTLRLKQVSSYQKVWQANQEDHTAQCDERGNNIGRGAC